MSQTPPPDEPGQVRVSDSFIRHSGPPEQVEVNKYQLLLVLDRMSRQGKRTQKLEWAAWAASAFVPMLVSLVTATFANVLWQALFIVGDAVAGVVTVILVVWGLVDVTQAHPTPEQVVENIIGELDEARRKTVGHDGTVAR